MSTAKSDFEPREAIQGLFNYVKDMASSAISRPVSSQPGEEQVDAAVLGALESGSKTASQISKAILVSAAGAWSPTDGLINKSLAKLADTDKVTVKTKADRKTYWMSCDPKFLSSASKLPPVMLDIAQTGTKEQQARAAEILDKVRHDLHKVLAEK